MRKGILLLVFLAAVLPGFPQNNAPVAVDDTVDVYLFDDTLTINVTHNDYDPEGDYFFILNAGGCISHTDSTITYAFPWSAYHTRRGLIKLHYYGIYDPVNTPDSLSIGWVWARFHNPFFDTLDINGVSALVNNRGNGFWDMQGHSHYEVPKGSQTNALFNFVLWVGGLDATSQHHLAGDRYGNQGEDFWPGPVSDLPVYTNRYDTAWNKTWKILRTDVEYHKNNWWVNGYIPPASILTWPGDGNPALGQAEHLAPYHDHNANGTYDPAFGDYPLIRGDQCVFFIMNDNRRPHTETTGMPLGIEVHAMFYAFDCPQDSALWYTTFAHFDIFNRSTTPFTSTYFGTFTDGDLGMAWDDYIGCDVPRSSFFFYNGEDIDGTGTAGSYGAFPPAVSTTLLAGPFLDPDLEDNPSSDSLGNPLCDLSVNGAYFADGNIDNERYGMNHFFYFNNDVSGPTTDPQTASEYYRFLEGNWKDGTHMKYGGNGHPGNGSTDVDCNFMFPGTSDFCNWGTAGIQPPGYITGAGGTGVSWTDHNAGNPPSDRRGVASMGPFTFQPGRPQPLDVAFVWARQYTDSSAMAVLPLLVTRIDQIRSYFFNDTTPCGGSFSGIIPQKAPPAALRVYPNPARERLFVEYPCQSARAGYVIYNLLGEMQAQGNLQGTDVHGIDLALPAPGMYVIVVKDGSDCRVARFIRY